MRVAIPYWQGRVSPVFDVAGNLLLVDVDDGVERGRRQVTLDEPSPMRRATVLAELGAGVLICGAISRPVESAIEAAGIRVIPQTCGEIECVLAAFVAGQLTDERFLMPGCCGRRRRFRGGRCG